MKQSPLSLDHYHFIEISIVPEVGYISKEDVYPDFSDANFASKVGIGQPVDDEESDKFALRLIIEISPKSEGAFPYSIDIGVEGFFTIVDKKSVASVQDMVLVNGAAMLYGALREQIVTITSRFEYGALMLPTVNFLDMIDSQTESAKKASSE